MSFDTRRKIITLDEARTLPAPVVVFVTHLEVLQAGPIRKLEALAATHPGKLLVLLTDPESPLVPMEDRAELAAALQMVDYVVPAPQGAGPALAAINPAVTVEDEAEDRGRTRWLVEHVRNRSRL